MSENRPGKQGHNVDRRETANLDIMFTLNYRRIIIVIICYRDMLRSL